MKMEDGLVITAIAPVSVRTQIDGVPVYVAMETDYPFKNSYRVHVKAARPVHFSLKLRIPGFAFNGTVDGQPAGEGIISRCWHQEETVSVSFRTQAQLRERPQGLYCLENGPLLFAVVPDTLWTKVEYECDGVERKYPYCDYYITASSPWNYAFAGTDFTREENKIGAIPFSPAEPPVTLHAKMVPISWTEKNGACTELPQSTTPLGEPVNVPLIPYGCTTLRMTEPLVK